MKKLPFCVIALLCMALLPLASCHLDDDDDEETSLAWLKANNEWLTEMSQLRDDDGNPYFEEIEPAWNTSSAVLMHWYNDRSLTAGNLVPLETSTVAVKYYLKLYDGTPVDSSYLQTDSLYITMPTAVIDGFSIALQNMHVGDSVRVLVPYTEGYGTEATSAIPAYSALDFEIKLVDITHYEIPNR